MEITNDIDFNVVHTIVQIAKRLEKSKLNNSVIEDIKELIEQLSKYLSTTSEQAMLFSIIFALQAKINVIDLRDLIKFLDISYIESLNLKSDIDKLIEKSLIEIDDENGVKFRKSKYGKSSFLIPDNISDQVYANQPIQSKEHEFLDIYGFVKTVSGFIEKRKYENIDTKDLFFMVEEFETRNEHLSKISLLKSKFICSDRTLLYEMFDDFLNYGMPSNLNITLNSMFDKPRERRVMFRSLTEKTNKLFELDYIELSNGRFANDFNLMLTNKAIEFFLGEDAELFKRNKTAKNVISHNDITNKDLFYDEKLGKEIEFLTQSLMEENFCTLQDRLSNMNLIKGVSAIFYGLPGGGKTASVFSIAKQTGRDIMKVEIQESKSMWFGESEKKIAEIFSNYQRLCSNSKKTPILLFNEADGILSKRNDNQLSSVDQTENSIQNIILEALEQFEGIAFFTTNLQGNLDSAYERRFLFKVKFDSPSTDVKAKIWLNKMPWIEPVFAMTLAAEFPLSGGEIDNIVRKVTMKEVLTGVRPDNSAIIEFCQCEKLLSGSNSHNRVGFI